MNAYILAGGHSKRMGRPKAELLLGGRTFADRVIDACAGAFEEVAAVSRSDAAPLHRIRTIREQVHEGTSPLYGIEAALDDATGRKVWIVGIDYPLVTSELLAWLAARFHAIDARMLVPSWDGVLQPLCAGYSASLVSEVRDRIRSGRFRLRDLASDNEAMIIPEEELQRFGGDVLRNVNTPEDLEAVRAEFADGGGSHG